MKSKLRAQRRALEELWRQGLSGKALLAEQSRLVDDYITEYFRAAGEACQGMAVVALGGYGRCELFPFSDIDLMLLYQPEVKESVGTVVDRVLYPLWDAGLEVGHGVRTVEESIEHAEEEFFFQVAMLDSRLLVGDQLLFAELQDQFRSRFIEGERKDFVETMKQLRDKRRQRFGKHSYLLEPHVKNGKGGMRDIQAMFWTAQVVFGLNDLTEIVESGILLKEEKEAFVNSWDMLVKVRNRLHYISGRKNEQLFFEQQEEIAGKLGYRNAKGVLGVEKFMRDLYGHLRVIAVTTDLFFEHVEEVLGLAGNEPGKPAALVLEEGIELRGNRVHLTASSAEIEAKPYLLMRLFLASSRQKVAIHHRTWKKLIANLAVLTDKICSSPRMTKPFFEILTKGESVLAVLETMLETGVLPSYIPEFKAIVTLAQHDLYHVYTVDRHLLQTVAELRKLEKTEEKIFQGIVKPKILYLAALLHDLGKGAGKDHSLYGAEIVLPIGKRLGFCKVDCQCLAFLVRYHLFIPENGLRRDLNDETFIHHCAEEIGDLDRLAMLYLLSVADSKATGPSAWSNWKGSLLFEMFLKVHAALAARHKSEDEIRRTELQKEQGVAWLRQRVKELLEGEEEKAVADNLGDDYLLSFTPEAIVSHLRSHIDKQNFLRQKALVEPRDNQDAWSLLILCRDRTGLLAKICGVLALHSLDVLNAEIFTWSGGEVVDIIDVRPTDGLSFSEKNWQALADDLNLALSHRLGLGHRLYRKLSGGHGVKKMPKGRKQPRVVVENQVSEKYTVIEVFSDDRPGQLYHITQAFTDFGVNIHKAFIATEVEQLIDVFYVLDEQGGKIEDPVFIEEIKDAVLYSATSF